nr:hypothetical protein CFP56_23941 [Quercus suber]
MSSFKQVTVAQAQSGWRDDEAHVLIGREENKNGPFNTAVDPVPSFPTRSIFFCFVCSVSSSSPDRIDGRIATCTNSRTGDDAVKHKNCP